MRDQILAQLPPATQANPAIAPALARRLRAPAGPEAPRARARRMGQQAATNRIRARQQPDGTWLVDSQQRGADGRRKPPYKVELVAGLGLTCPCDWGKRNPGGKPCSHQEQVNKQLARKARAERRAERQAASAYTDYCAGDDPRPPQTMDDRKRLVDLIHWELFDEARPAPRDLGGR